MALKVITRSPAPTMVMSSEATHKGYNKIVLPIDNTVNSRQKVPYTLEFAKKFGAKVYAIALVGSDEQGHKPALELVLVRPDGGDLGAAVARDHFSLSPAGRQSRKSWRTGENASMRIAASSAST